MSLLNPGNLARLLDAEPPLWQDGATPPDATGVSYHSSGVRPADVFFALPGGSGHGIDHADDALARGAAFIVSDRPHPRALLVKDATAALVALGSAARTRVRGRVVGVTGSTGKTTVKDMVAAALACRSTPGNLNTTPALVAALVEAALQDAGAVHATGSLSGTEPRSPLALELGIDRVGEMAELVALTRPDDALLTCVAEAHLSAFGDLATVAKEKGALLAGSPGARLAGYAAGLALPPELRAVTIAVRVKQRCAPGPSGGSDADAGFLRVVDFEFKGVSCARHTRLTGLDHELELPWPGRAMAENAALALTYAVERGVSVEDASDRIAGMRLAKHRLQRLALGSGARSLVVIDDVYNSNPASAALALEALRSESGPKAAFLGEMRELGAVSRLRHFELGAATRDLDLVVAVGPEASAIKEANSAALLANDLSAAAELLDLIPDGAAVLFKASRSVGMEWLVERLVESVGSRERHDAVKATRDEVGA